LFNEYKLKSVNALEIYGKHVVMIQFKRQGTGQRGYQGEYVNSNNIKTNGLVESSFAFF
jgi:hypothetical protein